MKGTNIMKSLWPFTLFPGGSVEKEAEQTETVTVETADDTAGETVVETSAETEVVEEAALENAAEPTAETVEETAEAVTEEAETASEETVLDEDTVIDDAEEDEDDAGDYEDLAFALEVDLEEAARIETEKAHKRNTIAVASLAILGAAGLATGFALRAYFKKRK